MEECDLLIDIIQQRRQIIGSKIKEGKVRRTLRGPWSVTADRIYPRAPFYYVFPPYTPYLLAFLTSFLL